VQVVEPLLALLGKDLAGRDTRLSPLHLHSPNSENLGVLIAVLTNIGVARLQQRPLAPVLDDHVIKYDKAFQPKLCLDVCHSFSSTARGR
jgi:hypothetical protein